MKKLFLALLCVAPFAAHGVEMAPVTKQQITEKYQIIEKYQARQRGHKFAAANTVLWTFIGSAVAPAAAAIALPLVGAAIITAHGYCIHKNNQKLATIKKS